MTLDTNFLIGLFAGIALMWFVDWLFFGRESGGRLVRELDDLRQELATYKKARTTAEANLQASEEELDRLRDELTKAQTGALEVEELKSRLAVTQTDLAEARLSVEELSMATTRTATTGDGPGTLSASTTEKPDNLQAIEGIGPKIEEVLYQAGIKTFARLAGSSVATLERIVREEAGIKVAYPDTWPQQAGLAAAGKWEELERMQDQLKGGRRRT